MVLRNVIQACRLASLGAGLEGVVDHASRYNCGLGSVRLRTLPGHTLIFSIAALRCEIYHFLFSSLPLGSSCRHTLRASCIFARGTERVGLPLILLSGRDLHYHHSGWQCLRYGSTSKFRVVISESKKEIYRRLLHSRVYLNCCFARFYIESPMARTRELCLRACGRR